MLEARSGSGSVIAQPRLIKPNGKEPAAIAKLIVNGLVAITPELAKRIILECGYERQRNVRSLHVSALAAQMRKREWTQGTQIHFAKMADGWLRLIDGQHRLHAVVESGVTVQFQVLVSDAKNETDVARLYRRHDRLVVRRTIVDTLLADGIFEKYEISRNLGRYVFGAALLIEARFEAGLSAKADPYLVRSDEARLRLCEPWWEYAVMAQDAMSEAPSAIKVLLYTQGALAVALITLRDQRAMADAFWRGVAKNDGLKRDDPRAAYLRSLNAEKQKTAFTSAKAASVAWNAFFAGEKLKFVRMTKSPIRIDGVKGL